VHSFDMEKESCIQSEENLVPEDETFNFITDIFFLTQKCICIGHRVVHEKFVQLNQVRFYQFVIAFPNNNAYRT
jgi:hypothetical protein